MPTYPNNSGTIQPAQNFIPYTQWSRQELLNYARFLEQKIQECKAMQYHHQPAPPPPLPKPPRKPDGWQPRDGGEPGKPPGGPWYQDEKECEKVKTFKLKGMPFVVSNNTLYSKIKDGNTIQSGYDVIPFGVPGGIIGETPKYEEKLLSEGRETQITFSRGFTITSYPLDKNGLGGGGEIKIDFNDVFEGSSKFVNEDNYAKLKLIHDKNTTLQNNLNEKDSNIIPSTQQKIIYAVITYGSICGKIPYEIIEIKEYEENFFLPGRSPKEGYEKALSNIFNSTTE